MKNINQKFVGLTILKSFIRLIILFFLGVGIVLLQIQPLTGSFILLIVIYSAYQQTDLWW